MKKNEQMEKLSLAILEIGQILLKNGAEIHQVEETMKSISSSFSSVENTECFVTTTGIILSITVDKKTYTQVCRIYSRNIDLNCIYKMNSLSRETNNAENSIYELKKRISEISNPDKYSLPITVFFAGVSTFGLCIFFNGSLLDSILAFILGSQTFFLYKSLIKNDINIFLANLLSAAFASFFAFLFQFIFTNLDLTIIVLSSIMVLIPGLSFTNALRDIVAGDYLSGISQIFEAFLISVSISVGTCLILLFNF